MLCLPPAPRAAALSHWHAQPPLVCLRRRRLRCACTTCTSTAGQTTPRGRRRCAPWALCLDALHCFSCLPPPVLYHWASPHHRRVTPAAPQIRFTSPIKMDCVESDGSVGGACGLSLTHVAVMVPASPPFPLPHCSPGQTRQAGHLEPLAAHQHHLRRPD